MTSLTVVTCTPDTFHLSHCSLANHPRTRVVSGPNAFGLSRTRGSLSMDAPLSSTGHLGPTNCVRITMLGLPLFGATRQEMVPALRVSAKTDWELQGYEVKLQ